ncbi:hypothetical protein RFI_00973 [Reticulomyxa filosa]|uniref:Uncharacterized protein n=1 Tax=Reticulomyxa filosa TaxID=46433 RepID=X6PDA2_RETFI|nr:hypothetical protein RFI_00973 [Reticulomyxa filosa]|eukprot:ETO36088.1 hypothetical protein RFI_00973 [Reticulomyxa filosa]
MLLHVNDELIEKVMVYKHQIESLEQEKKKESNDKENDANYCTKISETSCQNSKEPTLLFRSHDSPRNCNTRLLERSTQKQHLSTENQSQQISGLKSLQLTPKSKLSTISSKESNTKEVVSEMYFTDLEFSYFCKKLCTLSFSLDDVQFFKDKSQRTPMHPKNGELSSDQKSSKIRLLKKQIQKQLHYVFDIKAYFLDKLYRQNRNANEEATKETLLALNKEIASLHNKLHLFKIRYERMCGKTKLNYVSLTNNSLQNLRTDSLAFEHVVDTKMAFYRFINTFTSKTYLFLQCLEKYENQIKCASSLRLKLVKIIIYNKDRNESEKKAKRC